MGCDSGCNSSQGKLYFKSTFEKVKNAMFSLHEKSYSEQACHQKSMHMIYSTDKMQRSSLKGRRKCPDATLKAESD